MTKKKEKMPRGRPSKKQKEIYRDESDIKPVEIEKPAKKKPVFIDDKPKFNVPVAAETLNLSEKQPETAQKENKTTCATCKNELDAEKKAKFCPNCGIELNWSG